MRCAIFFSPFRPRAPPLTQARAIMAAGEGALKMARQAVKGMGQDGRFFRDSKRGA